MSRPGSWVAAGLTALAVAAPSAGLDLVAVRVPLDADLERCEGCRLVRIGPDSLLSTLTSGFVAAKDPALGFDGRTVYFAGRPTSEDRWQIWRLPIGGGEPVRIVAGDGDAVAPLPAGTIFHLDDEAPTPRLVYLAGANGSPPSLALHSADLDGRNPTRLSFHPGSDRAPEVLANGRLVFIADGLVAGGRSALMAVNLDGADLAASADPHSGPLHSDQLTVGPDRLWFVVPEPDAPLGGGRLASVATRRPLRSRTVFGQGPDLVFHSPRPLADGGLLASALEAGGPRETGYRLARVDPTTGEVVSILAHAEGAHLVDAQVITPRPPAHGRSSVVDPGVETGVLYCLASHLSDRPGVSEAAARARRVRVIRGTAAGADGPTAPETLGEAPLASDGSFHLEVPARTPLRLELLAETGEVVAAQNSWIWVMPRERRGCVGCHEDRELAPPNRLAEAVVRPAVNLAGDLGTAIPVDAEAPR